MEKIVVEWHGITLMEPVVFLTNWLISFQCLYYFKESYESSGRSSFHKNWRYFFLLFGLSTFFGGLSHLLFFYFDLTGKIPGWSCAILSITFLELAVLSFRKVIRNWEKLVWIQTALIFILLLFDFKFLWVTLQTIIGLVLVLGVYSIIQVRNGEKGWKGYLFGIGWMIVSVPVVILEVDPAIWFNRHDISHLFMMLCLHQFYRATLIVQPKY